MMTKPAASCVLNIVRCVPPSTRPNSLCEHLIGAHLSAATGAAASACFCGRFGGLFAVNRS